MTKSSARIATFDSGAWRQLCELVDDRDVGFLEGIFQTYLKAAQNQVETLRNSDDTELKRRAAHTLLGSSLSIGVTPIATICRKLELELGRVPVEDMAERLAKIEDYLARVRQDYPLALAEMVRDAVG